MTKYEKIVNSVCKKEQFPNKDKNFPFPGDNITYVRLGKDNKTYHCYANKICVLISDTKILDLEPDNTYKEVIFNVFNGINFDTNPYPLDISDLKNWIDKVKTEFKEPKSKKNFHTLQNMFMYYPYSLDLGEFKLHLNSFFLKNCLDFCSTKNFYCEKQYSPVFFKNNDKSKMAILLPIKKQ